MVFPKEEWILNFRPIAWIIHTDQWTEFHIVDRYGIMMENVLWGKNLQRLSVMTKELPIEQRNQSNHWRCDHFEEVHFWSECNFDVSRRTLQHLPREIDSNVHKVEFDCRYRDNQLFERQKCSCSFLRRMTSLVSRLTLTIEQWTKLPGHALIENVVLNRQTIGDVSPRSVVSSTLTERQLILFAIEHDQLSN